MGRFGLAAVLLAVFLMGCGGDGGAEKYMHEGLVQFQPQHYDQAIQSYTQAIKLEPQAAPWFKKALELNPAHPEKPQLEKMIAAGEKQP